MNPEATESPLRRIRRELDLTHADLAMICEIAARTIGAVERGSSPDIPQKILTGLVELGYDPDQVAGEHRAFLQARRAELLARAKARRD